MIEPFSHLLFFYILISYVFHFSCKNSSCKRPSFGLIALYSFMEVDSWLIAKAGAV